MSRIGKKPIIVPQNVTANIDGNNLYPDMGAIDAVGGLREGFEGGQDHDLLLRCVAKLADPARQVVHIPRVLYHWRSSEGSTALAGSEKDYAARAGLKAVNNYLENSGEAAVAEAGRFPNT